MVDNQAETGKAVSFETGGGDSVSSVVDIEAASKVERTR
jgi:hypothetical protein